jgi:hypothetical protein
VGKSFPSRTTFALLEARGFALSDSQGARIRTATDAELDPWLIRVLSASDAAGVLGD